MKKLTVILSVILVLCLCMALSACGSSKDSKSAASDQSADTATEAPTEAPTEPGYQVDEATLHLEKFGTDPAEFGSELEDYKKEDGVVVLEFVGDGKKMTYGGFSDFVKGIEIDECTFKDWQNVRLAEDYEGDLSEIGNAPIDSDASLYVIFDAPEGYEITKDKIHIS